MSRRRPAPLPERSRHGAGRVASRATAFGVDSDSASPGVFRMLAVDAIAPNPDQPRRRFDPDALAALAASIAERGVLQPIVVRPLGSRCYQLVTGERRWRATRHAGLQRIPAVVRDRDDADALQDALIENAAREDLSPIEQARCLRLVIDDLGVSQRTLAAQLGDRSHSDIANTLRLLDLPDHVIDLIDAGRLTKGHGKALLALPDAAARAALARRAATDGWSVRQLVAVIAHQRSSRTTRRARSTDANRREAAARLTTALDGTGRVVATHEGFALCLPASRLRELERVVAELGRRSTV